MTAQVASSVASSAPPLPSAVAGRATSSAPPVALLSPSAPGRPSQLDDADWLRRRYAQDGDNRIAEELGCAPLTVRRARERLGIASEPTGRRRGRSLQAVPADGHQQPSGEIVLTGTALAIVTRFNEDQKHFGGAPATDELLAARIRAYSEAKLAGDRLAIEDALLAIASAAGLIHQHQQRLRKGSA